METYTIKTDVDFFGEMGHELFFYDIEEYETEIEIRYDGDEIVSVLVGGCEVDSEWDCFDDLVEACMELWKRDAESEMNNLAMANAELDYYNGARIH